MGRRALEGASGVRTPSLVSRFSGQIRVYSSTASPHSAGLLNHGVLVFAGHTDVLVCRRSSGGSVGPCRWLSRPAGRMGWLPTNGSAQKMPLSSKDKQVPDCSLSFGWKAITEVYILATEEAAEAGWALALQGSTVALAWGFACRLLRGVPGRFRCKAEPLVCAARAAVPGHVRVGLQKGINVQPAGTGGQ